MENKPALTPRQAQIYTGIAILLGSIGLTIALLPSNLPQMDGFEKLQRIATVAVPEILRALLLVVNVQVLRAAGQRAYALVLIGNVAITVLLAVAIHALSVEVGADFFHWQAANLGIFMADLVLSLVVAGKTDSWKVLEGMLHESQEREEALQSAIKAAADSAGKSSLDELVALTERLTGLEYSINHLLSWYSLDSVDALGTFLKSILDQNEVLKERGHLEGILNEAHKHNMGLFAQGAKVNGLGKKTNTCDNCGTIVVAQNNGQERTNCPNCEAMIIF